MLAVRSIQDVVVDSVTVKLPAGFAGKRVEVIVLPLEDNEQDIGRLESLLLTAPTLSEPDLQAFGQVRDWMNQRTVGEF